MDPLLRILIVEDNASTAMLIEEGLEQAGYAVCGKAGDYKEAMMLMKKELPDVVLVDIGLKGPVDGIQTARDLMHIKPVPLLYLTAHTDDETYNRAKQTAPAAFLYKPWRIQELIRQVDLAAYNQQPEQKSDLLGTSDYIYLPDGGSKFRVYINRIIYIQADGAYAKIHLTKEESDRLKLKKPIKPLHVSSSLGSLLDYLPASFYRLSRSYAINLHHLERIEPSQLIMNEEDKPITLPEGGLKKLLNYLRVVRSGQRS